MRRVIAPGGNLPNPHPSYEVAADWPEIADGLGAEAADALDRCALSGITAVRYRCNGLWRIQPARRVADDMFFYILGGRGAMDVAGRRARFGPGDLLHWRRGVEHTATTDDDDPIEVISLHYTATIDGAVHLPELLGFPDLFRLGPGHALEAIADEACREYALRPSGWRRSLEALLARFLATLARSHARDLRPELGGAHLRDLRRVLPAIHAMRETIGAPLAMPALARRCRLSEAQFRRVFARAVGTSPVAHQRAVRFAEACRLLRESDEPVEAIAERVGYADQSFFTRAFRSTYGMTPGKYRAQAHV